MPSPIQKGFADTANTGISVNKKPDPTGRHFLTSNFVIFMVDLCYCSVKLVVMGLLPKHCAMC